MVSVGLTVSLSWGFHVSETATKIGLSSPILNWSPQMGQKPLSNGTEISPKWVKHTQVGGMEGSSDTLQTVGGGTARCIIPPPVKTPALGFHSHGLCVSRDLLGLGRQNPPSTPAVGQRPPQNDGVGGILDCHPVSVLMRSQGNKPGPVTPPDTPSEVPEPRVTPQPSPIPWVPGAPPKPRPALVTRRYSDSVGVLMAFPSGAGLPRPSPSKIGPRARPSPTCPRSPRDAAPER